MLPNFMAEKLIINYEDYKLAVEKLALTIEKNYKPSVLVGIMRGAAPIIDMLSRIFKLPTAYVVIQSYSGETVENKQGELIFARDISSIAKNEDFKNVLLVDDLYIGSITTGIFLYCLNIFTISFARNLLVIRPIFTPSIWYSLVSDLICEIITLRGKLKVLTIFFEFCAVMTDIAFRQ